MSADPVVLVTSRSFSTGLQDVEGRLREAGLVVVRGRTDHELRALAPILRRAVAWIAGTSAVTAAHLEAAPDLQVVARYGVGVDAVDIAAAASHKVLVTNTPGANTAAVADHSIALMLAAIRGIPQGDRAVRSGDWTGWQSRELGALVVGLIGFGRIGQAVAKRLAPFGCRVLAADPFVPDEILAGLGVERADVNDLPSRCDVVSLHAPGGRVLVDAAWLANVARPLIVVNTARAALVDPGALAAAIRDGTLFCYAADVLDHEFGSDASPMLSPDLSQHVIMTPHVAAQTVEAVDAMGMMAVDNVLAVLSGSDPPNLATQHRSSS